MCFFNAAGTEDAEKKKTDLSKPTLKRLEMKFEDQNSKFVKENVRAYTVLRVHERIADVCGM